MSLVAVARVKYVRDEMLLVDAGLIRPCGIAIGLWCKAFADNKGNAVSCLCRQMCVAVKCWRMQTV